MPLYYQANHNKKKTSEASLSVATGEISVSERDYLLQPTLQDDGEESHRRHPAWVSRTISFEQNGCSRKSVTKLAVLTIAVAVLIGLVTFATQRVYKKDTFHDVAIEDTTSNTNKESEYLQWWQEPANIPINHVEPSARISQNYRHSFRKGADARWGILGAGRIARDFTTALRMAGSHVQAVAAGSLPNTYERARNFASTYEIPNFYGSYEELAADPTVDIVYVATTNQLHRDNVIQMLEAGKNVLVEKPMAVTYEEAQAMAAAAKKNQRLLLTNFWTRFFPIYSNYTLPMVRDGALSTSDLAMRGDFAFAAPPHNPSSDRLLERYLGGGAMLDLGCYLVNVAVMVASTTMKEEKFANGKAVATTLRPMDIEATGSNVYQGEKYFIDTEVSFSLHWGSPTIRGEFEQNITKSNTKSFFMSGQVSFRRPSSFEVEITGSDGRLKIHRPGNAPYAATLYQHDLYGPVKGIEKAESFRVPFDNSFGTEQYPGASGFLHVISAIEECMMKHGIPGRAGVVEGCLEMKELTMDEQLLTVEITEDVMRKIGYWNQMTG